jgi:hypothetical protein
MNRSRRKQVRKIIDGASNLVFERQPLLDFLLANLSDFFRRKGASSVYQFSEETLSFLSGVDNVFFIGAGHPDKIEAVSVLAYTPYSGEAFLQISLPGSQNHAVEMVWFRMNYLKSLQVELFNLGGGVQQDDSLARFKRSFGGRKVDLACLKQIYEPEVYHALCQETKTDPRCLTGYFPSYRSAQFY